MDKDLNRIEKVLFGLRLKQVREFEFEGKLWCWNKLRKGTFLEEGCKQFSKGAL